MSEGQKQEVVDFYSSYIFKGISPEYDTATEKLIDDGTEIIDNKIYTKYAIVALTTQELEDKRLASIPQILSMRQAKLALLDKGLLSSVNTAIANSTDEVLKIEWEYADEIRRDWVSLNIMAESLGMTQLDIDDLFILGATK